MNGDTALSAGNTHLLLAVGALEIAVIIDKIINNMESANVVKNLAV